MFTQVILILLIVIDNQAVYGGDIYCKNCFTFDLEKPEFTNNYAFFGGVMYLKYDSLLSTDVELILNELEISESHALIDGGFIYFDGSDIDINFTVSESEITKSSSNIIDLTSFSN